MEARRLSISVCLAVRAESAGCLAGRREPGVDLGGGLLQGYRRGSGSRTAGIGTVARTGDRG